MPRYALELEMEALSVEAAGLAFEEDEALGEDARVLCPVCGEGFLGRGDMHEIRCVYRRGIGRRAFGGKHYRSRSPKGANALARRASRARHMCPRAGDHCGLDLPDQLDGLSLDDVRARLAGVFDAHRATGCGAQPRFSVDQVGGVSMLSCRCAACGYYEIVV